jgi:hypothetical protein
MTDINDITSDNSLSIESISSNSSNILKKDLDEKLIKKNIVISLNRKHFIESILNIVDLVKNTSEKINFSELDMNVKKNILLKEKHIELRKNCFIIRNELIENKNNKLQGKIIKKIYRTLTQYIDKIYENKQLMKNISLFSIKENNKLISVISGIDVSLVLKYLTIDELNIIWNNIYMLYVSSVMMVSLNNNLQIEGKYLEALNLCAKECAKSGLIKDDKFLNPFVGIGISDLLKDNTKYNMDTLYSNIEDYKEPTGLTIDNLISISGFDKFFNMEEFNNQLKDMNFENTTKELTNILGNDNDITEVCNTLMGSMMEKVKNDPNGGILGLINAAKSVTQEVGSKLDKDKMEKTVNKMQEFMSNSKEKLKELKDQNGNNIGGQLMESLEAPLKIIESFDMGSGKKPDMGQLQNIINQLGSMMNQKPSANTALNAKTK